MKRVFLIVLDSVGIGEAPDAALFGDEGANTLAGVVKSTHLRVPTLTALGLGNIDGVTCLPAVANPSAAYARVIERSQGKDTTIGHWEIAGLYSPTPLPTFPDGFPAELLDAFSRAVGRGVLCNQPYSGTKVIADFGEEHLKTGALIVYTSADSVFQIAAHEEIVPPEELYRICRIARELLVGEYAVGRVIARPFIGTKGAFTRTGNRRDFSIAPPAETLCNALANSKKEVIAVGKIADIFAGSGITEHIPTHSNDEGMAALSDLIDRDFEGLCFANLVDFDSHYGHRRDTDGYAKALSRFDEFLSGWLSRLREEDLLIITADHGCDPTFLKTTDHTREYVPVLIYGRSVDPKNLGTLPTFADIGATVADYLSISYRGSGSSRLLEVLR